MKPILAIVLAIVLGFASLAIAQPDTLANAVSFLLDLINVQSEQIDQVRIEVQAINADGINDEINDLWRDAAQQAVQIGDLQSRLEALEAVQTPSLK